MAIALWILIIICFTVAFVGLLYPIIPSVVVLWIGFLLYLGIDQSQLTISFWILQLAFTIFLFIADFITNRYFLKKYGSTKWGERIGMISILAGSFVFPPFGLLLVPFLSVFITEWIQEKNTKQALQVAFATVISFLSSTAAKAIVQIMMIIVFLLYIWL